MKGNSIISANTNIQELHCKGRLTILIILVKERKKNRREKMGVRCQAVSLTYVMESN